MAAKQVKKQAPLTASEFVSSYNATMTAKTGNAELDQRDSRDEDSFAREVCALGKRGALEVRLGKRASAR